MYAKRLILETDELGNIKELPKLPANKQFETLFSGAGKCEQTCKTYSTSRYYQ